MGKPKKTDKKGIEYYKSRLAEAEGFEKEIFSILGLQWHEGCKCGGTAQAIIRKLLIERDERRIQREGCEQTPAVYCDHANEVPCTCPCANNCYCKSYTCRSR